MADEVGKKQVRGLRTNAFERGRAEAAKYQFPDGLAIGAGNPGGGKHVAAGWAAGFAAGWAARDCRDDEPPAGSYVWVVDNSGRHFVAIRVADVNEVDAFSTDAVWEVNGRPERITWAEVLEDAREWARLDKVG